WSRSSTSYWWPWRASTVTLPWRCSPRRLPSTRRTAISVTMCGGARPSCRTLRLSRSPISQRSGGCRKRSSLIRRDRIRSPEINDESFPAFHVERVRFVFAAGFVSVEPDLVPVRDAARCPARHDGLAVPHGPQQVGQRDAVVHPLVSLAAAARITEHELLHDA